MRRPIAVQLYTLREASAAGFASVIERVGRIGYDGVEPAGLYGMSPKELRSRVADAGMRICSTHTQGRMFGDELERVLDDQAAMGCDTVVVPSLPRDRFGDVDGVKAMADRLNGAVDAVTARGMRLGYHNHYWEFGKLSDGRTAYDAFVAELRPEVLVEVDVYWAQTGGAQAAELCARLGDRCRLLHVKDGPATTADPMVAVGSGSMDIPAILDANQAVEWHIVELDRCATDMWEAVERSYDYLAGLP